MGWGQACEETKAWGAPEGTDFPKGIRRGVLAGGFAPLSPTGNGTNPWGMNDSTTRSTLPPIGILENLPDEARTALAASGKFSSLPEGFYLVKQGDPQDLLYILVSGKLSATARSDSSVVELGMIMPGESVGEMNVIDPKKASADVKSVISSRVWSISKEALDRYVDENPVHGVRLLRSISIQLCRRIRRNSDKMLRQLETASTIYEWLD